MALHVEALVMLIAQALNEAGIPCVLWGHCLLQVHGVPTIIGSIDFVIPDDCLPAGEQVLAQLAQQIQQTQTPGRPGSSATDTPPAVPCPDGNTCFVVQPTRATPPPAAHSHLQDSEVTVGLYCQRDTLWFLPPLGTLGVLPPLSALLPYFVLATDQTVLPPQRCGRGSGFFYGQYRRQWPVVAPQAHVLLEAYMRQYARDAGTRTGPMTLCMIMYMSQYVYDDGYLDTSQFPDTLQQLFEDLCQEKKMLKPWTVDLRRTLADNPGSDG